MKCRFVGDMAIFDLTGRFVVTAGETEILPLRSAVRTLIADERTLLALNLAGLTSIDARGLGELVSMRTALRSSGGELVLIAPTAVVSRMLSITRLDAVIPSCGSELEAACRLRRTDPSLESPSQSDCGALGFG